MKYSKFLFFASLFSLLFFTACQPEEDFDREFEDEYVENDDFNNDQDSSGDSDGESGELSRYAINGDQISLIKDYQVSGSNAGWRDDKGKHFEMWDFFAKIISKSERGNIGEYAVTGDEDWSAYVAPINDDLSNWEMGVNIIAQYNNGQLDKSEFAFVALHEYAHVKTLNSSQIDDTSSGCSNYSLEEGCSRNGSYINGFYQNYWTDIAAEHKRAEDKGDSGIEAFYNKYSSRFVSDYAATNPAEDIAESFAEFILKEKTVGRTIAEQKINYFYDFPDLVQIRTEFKKNIPTFHARGATPRARRVFSKKGCVHK